MLALALRLGKTLQELRSEMSAEELLLWKAYNEQSPISDMRGDVQAAITAAAALQAQGAKISAVDMLPKWTPEPEALTEEQQVDEGEAMLKAFLVGAVAAT